MVDRKRETATRFSYEFETGRRACHRRAGRGRTGRPGGGRPRSRPESGLPPDPVPGRYAQVVEQAREKFARGDLFEVVPGHTFYAPCPAPAAFFERLRERNPAPYEFFLNLGEDEYLVGASPEMYVRVTGDRVETCPISGTIARGAGRAGGRRADPDAADLAQGRVRADHVHGRGPQRQVAGLRAGQRARSSAAGRSRCTAG